MRTARHTCGAGAEEFVNTLKGGVSETLASCDSYVGSAPQEGVCLAGGWGWERAYLSGGGQQLPPPSHPCSPPPPARLPVQQPNLLCLGGAVGEGAFLFPGEAPPLTAVLDAGGPQKREMVLKDLQKHFRGAWLVYIQDLSMVTLPACCWGRPRGSVPLQGRKRAWLGPHGVTLPQGNVPKGQGPLSLLRLVG